MNVWREEGHAIIVGVGGRSGTDGLTFPKQGIINFLSLTWDVSLRKTRLQVWHLVAKSSLIRLECTLRLHGGMYFV